MDHIDCYKDHIIYYYYVGHIKCSYLSLQVSFQEGDIIINGEIIDDGWMSGTVKRTGQTGMLPSNYVEPI